MSTSTSVSSSSGVLHKTLAGAEQITSFDTCLRKAFKPEWKPVLAKHKGLSEEALGAIETKVVNAVVPQVKRAFQELVLEPLMRAGVLPRASAHEQGTFLNLVSTSLTHNSLSGAKNIV